MNLNGKRILITRPRAQAEEFATALIAVGAQPIFFPVIEIIPPDDFSDLDRALQNLTEYDWLILTSIHPVTAFFNRLAALDINHIPPRLRMAVVGSKTARALSEHGISPDYIPNEYSVEAILLGLGEEISGKHFLLPQSDLALKSLANGICFSGGIVDVVVAYRNVPAQPEVAAINELRTGVDFITFTSPSTVRNFLALVQKKGLDPFNLPGSPCFACIGPITTKAAELAGFVNPIVANEFTTDGLIEVIVREGKFMKRKTSIQINR